MWLLGGGRLRPIVSTPRASLLLLTTASITTICRPLRPFLHRSSGATISSNFFPNRSRNSSNTASAPARTFATYYPPRPRLILDITPLDTITHYQHFFLTTKSAVSSVSLSRPRMASTFALPRFPLFEAISRHDPTSTVVAHSVSGRTFQYGELLPDVCRARDRIYEAAGKPNIRGERIAFLVENSYDYIVTFLAILASRAVALPLSPPFPAPELQYILTQSQASLLLHSAKFAAKAQEVLTTPWPESSPNTDPEFKPNLQTVALPKHTGLARIDTSFDAVAFTEEVDTEGAGMMLYTSGTTTRPKGVLIPETALTAQSQALIEAWQYSPADRLLHILPLHHIHGTVNGILAPLFAGSTIEFLFPFNADTVWQRFANPFLEPTKADAFPNSNITTPLPSVLSHTISEACSTGATTPLSIDATPACLDVGRVAQIAAELYGIVQLASGSNNPPGATNTALSAQNISRISQLTNELNEVVRPEASLLSTLSVSTAHANGNVNGNTNGNINGATTHNEKFPNMCREKITFFTVVPTVYTRLLSTHKGLSPDIAEAGRIATSPEHMRVAISGSAALPTPVKRAWKELSRGNVLLERYGMTEVGMALSCGLEFADRVDGSVGWPLPGVEVRLVDTDTNEIIPANVVDRSGEIQLRGSNVFREYWANPTATAKEFLPADDNKGHWFKTGDVAVRREVPAPAGNGTSGVWAQGPMYFILGRQSADIIKSGGEKVSALEVERELLSLPEVLEAAVLAVPSGKWGQKVGAVVILDRTICPEGWKPMDMRRALKGRLANYKIPQVLRVVEDIPRNAMGKINKKNLLRQVFLDEFSGDEL